MEMSILGLVTKFGYLPYKSMTHWPRLSISKGTTTTSLRDHIAMVRIISRVEALPIAVFPANSLNTSYQRSWSKSTTSREALPKLTRAWQLTLEVTFRAMLMPMISNQRLYLHQRYKPNVQRVLRCES